MPSVPGRTAIHSSAEAAVSESRGSTWTSLPRRPVRPWRNSPYARVVCTGELDASRSDAPREST